MAAPEDEAARTEPAVTADEADVTAETGDVPRPLFEGAEHTAIGDAITLYFDQGRTVARDVRLRLPNGLALTYGQVVALAGDFYGIPEAPISDGRTADERRQRFGRAFDSLARKQESKAEATEILKIMEEEFAKVAEALREGRLPSQAYKELGDSLSAKWNQATGGGHAVPPWIPPGRYLNLASTNWDHFTTYARLAYQAGHGAALRQALSARSISDPERRRLALELAYAMNAFADHFLSDLFSTGHLRTPRKELYDTITPSTVGSLLARYMHDEDSHWGLAVRNRRGNRWKGYGDKRYGDTVASMTRNLVHDAVQLSADEVFGAYDRGHVPDDPDEYAALWVTADLRAAQDRNDRAHQAPMFVWDGKTVLRRKNLNDLGDFSWTDDWWGWSTLAWLRQNYAPAPPAFYLQAPRTAPRLDPDGWRRTQPIPPNWVDGNRVRYAVSFVNGLDESDTGPWTPWITLRGKYFPTLRDVPVDRTGRARARHVFRQFAVGDTYGEYVYVGELADNTTTTFIDETP